MDKKIIIVDFEDNILGYKKKGTLEKGDLFRVSALWIKNSRGDYLLSQRSFLKNHHPGKWGPVVEGTNLEGETYEENIIRKAKEEIGLLNINPIKKIKVRVGGLYPHIHQWFFLDLDNEVTDFITNKNEIQDMKWFSEKELFDELKNNPNNYLIDLNEKYLFNNL